MTFNPNIHHRKSMRLREYDYAQNGCYFVTLCTYQKMPLFGRVIDGSMVLNELGVIANKEWKKIETLRPNIELDEWVVMPNHVHGVLCVCTPVGAHCMRPSWSGLNDNIGRVQRAPTIGDIVRGYKSAVTGRVKTLNVQAPIWQRNYHDRIIRSDAELSATREHIHNNPLQWALDELYVLE